MSPSPFILRNEHRKMSYTHLYLPMADASVRPGASYFSRLRTGGEKTNGPTRAKDIYPLLSHYILPLAPLLSLLSPFSWTHISGTSFLITWTTGFRKHLS